MISAIWCEPARASPPGRGARASGGQVKRLLIWLDMEGVPAVGPSQGDLAAGQQGPKQHGRRFGCGQDALGLDPALELLVQALDRVGRAQ